MFAVRWFCLDVLILAATIATTLREADAAQVIYASSTFEGVVYSVDPSGRKSVFAAGLGQPHGIAVDNQGNVYVAEVDRDRITKITPSGVQSTFYQFPDSRDNPEALAFGADGALFVAGTIRSPSLLGTNYLYRISPEGVATPFAPVGIQENLGIAIDSDGVMYVSDLAGGGAIWKVLGQDDSSPYVTGGFSSGPWGLALDGRGDLYATDPLGSVIERFSDTPTGVDRSIYADIIFPFSLAFDSGGRLFVGQENSISIITRGGSQRILASGFSSVRGIAISDVH